MIATVKCGVGAGEKFLKEKKKNTKMCVLWSVLSWKKGCVC